MKTVITLSIAVLLAGCATPANYQAAEVRPLAADGVLVAGMNIHDTPFLGLMNGNYAPQIEIARTHMVAGVYSRIGLSAEYRANIEDGHIVMSLPETKDDEAYVLLGYRGNPVSGWRFSFNCAGPDAPIFRVKGGEVVYVGDFDMGPFKREFAPRGVSWQREWHMDLPGAKSFLQRKFPELAGRIVTHPVELADTTVGMTNCRN